jgi:hypothetical protein
MKGITWKSPLFLISSVDIRTIAATEKKYAVVKTRFPYHEKASCNRQQRRHEKEITFMCFKESLLPLLEPDNIHVFEGDISFSWGNTYLCITKLYDDEGNRLLRSVPKEKRLCPDCGYQVGCVFLENNIDPPDDLHCFLSSDGGPAAGEQSLLTTLLNF